MTREEINKDKQKEIFYEEGKEKAKKIIKILLKTIITIFIIGFSFFSYETYYATVKLEVREYRVNNVKIPDTFNGLKIMQISDLHYGSTMFDKNLKDIVKLSNERKPDIIVFTGDLIDKDYKISKEEQETLIKRLAKLDATLGKYAIKGDEDKDKDKINIIYNQSNINLLKNEYELIYNESNNPILLVGLSSLLNDEQDYEEGYKYFKQEVYNSEIYTITLVHEPDSIDDIVNNYPKTDLILAGHSHNGDIRVPFTEYPLIQKNGAKKYNKSEYKVNSTKVFISGGLGTNNQIGIRLFTRPSINLYRLSNK